MQKQKKIALVSVIVIVLVVLWLALRGTPSGDSTEVSAEKFTPEGLPVVTLPKPKRNHDVPNFAEISDTPTRKAEFFSYLLPAVNEQNALISLQREKLLELRAKHGKGEALTAIERAWLDDMAAHYRVDATSDSGKFATLIRRVDIIPDTLVLVQAANESGWGTSRFALNARNFFGQWCWTEGCGLVPGSRGEGQVHEVREFSSATESVRSYIRNLNTHDAYQDLRQIRADLRQANMAVTAQPLTQGLMAYSERGEEYIIELNQMIRVNLPIIQAVREEIKTDEEQPEQTASVNTNS